MKRRGREGLCHQDRRRAVTAADVGDLRPRARSLSTTPSRAGSQRGDQVGVVAGAEEPLAALVHVVVVVVPADAGAGPGRLGDPRRVVHGAERDLEEAGQVGGARLVGQRHRLLGRQGVAAAVGVVVDDSRRRPARSATRGRSARPVPVRSASSAGVSGPAPASAR